MVCAGLCFDFFGNVSRGAAVADEAAICIQLLVGQRIGRHARELWRLYNSSEGRETMLGRVCLRSSLLQPSVSASLKKNCSIDLPSTLAAEIPVT